MFKYYFEDSRKKAENGERGKDKTSTIFHVIDGYVLIYVNFVHILFFLIE